MKILVADDEVVSRRLIESSLRRWGYDVVAASDGLEAAAILDGPDAPKLAVLDWMMPVVDGQHFLQALRQDYGRRTPVLVISAGRVSPETAQAAGADAYLQKPLDIDELMRVLGELVDRSKLDRGENTPA